MMDGFTPEFTVTSTLRVGVVYKITAPELIDTTVPHHFIIVAIENDDSFMCLCTSQRNKKITYFLKKGFDLDTLANIEPNINNGLTTQTYVNCNEYYEITKSELINKCARGELVLTGNLSLDEYTVLRNSIFESDFFDLPKYLLVHPDEEN